MTLFFVFFSSFITYLYCAYPALAPRDGADLLKSALTLYPAHPPGYPLYALSGHLFSLLFPFGNFAYRLNLLSALWGASSGVFLYLWARNKVDNISAAGISLAFVLSRSLWKFSLLPEMYSAQAFFLSLLLYLLEGHPQSHSRRLLLSSLAVGIGVVNHQSLIFSLPAFAYLWFKNSPPETKSSFLFKWAGLFFLLGMGLYAYMPIELQSIPVAFQAVTRAQYGTLELFAGLAQPTSLHLFFNQAFYLTKQLWKSSSPLLIPVALLGFWFGWKNPKEKNSALALLIGFLISGPGFLFLSRMETSNWIAQSALEPIFIPATFFLCALAVLGLAMIRSQPLRVFLATGMALWAFESHFPRLSHRDDFSAEDYVEDLFRLLPPSSAVLARGDTAVFGLKYKEALDPMSSSRLIHSDVDLNPTQWLFKASQVRSAFTLGISFSELKSLGIAANPKTLSPCALIQKVSSSPGEKSPERTFWAMTVLRPGPQLEYSNSYAHDIRKSFALAHYQDSLLDAQKDPALSDWNARWAAVLDPEDYHLVLK